MRDKLFEETFANWHIGTFKAEENIITKRLGFLYRTDDESFRNSVFFYARDKKDLVNFISSVIEKAKNFDIELINGSVYIKIGKIKGHKKVTTVYISKDDVYKDKTKNIIDLINNIEEIPTICPCNSYYIYRVPARFSVCFLD